MAGDCGKIGYATQTLALQALYYLQARASRKDKPVPIRIYYCKRCSRWHVTSQPKAEFTAEQESQVKDFLWFLNQML